MMARELRVDISTLRMYCTTKVKATNMPEGNK